MNSERSIYPVRYEWVDDGDYMIREWNVGWVEIWKYITASFQGTYTFPVVFYRKPIVLDSFQSTRASSSYDRELGCSNITTTNCSFVNYTVGNQGGQGGFFYFCGRKAS